MSENIMSRGDLVRAIAVETDVPATTVESVLKSYEATVLRQLESRGEVRQTGFGSFKVTERLERHSRNPRTGDAVHVPARSVARFTPGKLLKAVGLPTAQG